MAILLCSADSKSFALVPVKRMHGSAGAITVTYATADGTACAGVDYERAEGERARVGAAAASALRCRWFLAGAAGLEGGWTQGISWSW